MVLEPVEHGSLADVFGLVVDMFERLINGDEHGVVCRCRIEVLHNLFVLVDDARQDACVIAAGDTGTRFGPEKLLTAKPLLALGGCPV